MVCTVCTNHSAENLLVIFALQIKANGRGDGEHGFGVSGAEEYIGDGRRVSERDGSVSAEGGELLLELVS